MKFLGLTLFVALLTGCASLLSETQRVNRDVARAKRMSVDGPDQSGIVNGHELTESSKDSKLAALLLITRESSLNACTGVLISKRVILTAAHCVAGVEPKKIRVVFKTQGAPAESPSDFKAEKVVVHEKFNGKPEGFSDLALVKLKADAPSNYLPVTLMTSKDKPSADEITLIGYGITGEDKKDSMILRETTKSFKNEIHLKDGYVGIDQKSSTGGFCRGDSGAPIFAKVGSQRKLLGINSFTVGIEENKDCHTASVAMLSATFEHWISDHASKL